MAEEVVAYVGAALWDAGYYAAGYYVETYGAAALTAAAFAGSVYNMREQARKAANAQRAAYEASLKDRYVMIRSSTAPRQFVLGRQRVSGPIVWYNSWGTDRRYLDLIVVLAAHECDAIEAIYFDDELVTLADGGGDLVPVLAVNTHDTFSMSTATATFTLSTPPDTGSVTATVAYGTTYVTLTIVSISGSDVAVSGGTVGSVGTVTIRYQAASSPWLTNVGSYSTTETVSVDGSGNGSVTLAHAPTAGTVGLYWNYNAGSNDDPQVNTPIPATAYTVVGSVVTVTGAPYVSTTFTVVYTYGVLSIQAYVTKRLGQAGQAALTGLGSNWDSSHTMSGMCYVMVRLKYDPGAFPNGIPNISARVRGAKLYDPRNGHVEWSENPVLMMRYVATHELLGRLGTTLLDLTQKVDDVNIAAQATVCDASTSYVVNGQTYVRPLYTGSLVVTTDQRAKDGLDELAKAIAGRWCFVDGTLRVKAGAYATPLQSIDDTWLTNGQAVQVQTRANRGDVFNSVTGKFADASRDYVVTDFPRVIAAPYVIEDRGELPLDISLNAVSFSGQAQQVVAVQLRDARKGLHVVLLCNMNAWTAEVFDTVYVTLSRFGWVNKTFEVLDVSWLIDGGIQLTLKETDALIYQTGLNFDPPMILTPAPATLTLTGYAPTISTASAGVFRVATKYSAFTGALPPAPLASARSTVLANILSGTAPIFGFEGISGGASSPQTFSIANSGGTLTGTVTGAGWVIETGPGSFGRYPTEGSAMLVMTVTTGNTVRFTPSYSIGAFLCYFTDIGDFGSTLTFHGVHADATEDVFPVWVSGANPYYSYGVYSGSPLYVQEVPDSRGATTGTGTNGDAFFFSASNSGNPWTSVYFTMVGAGTDGIGMDSIQMFGAAQMLI